MDPKMDSGFLAPGESLDDDYDVLRKLLPEEVIGIIDQLICFEVGIRCAFNIPMWTKSDADDRANRWRGIWVIHYHSRCSLPATLTGYYGQSRRLYSKRASIVGKKPVRITYFCIWFYEHIAWLYSRPVISCLLVWEMRSITKSVEIPPIALARRC